MSSKQFTQKEAADYLANERGMKMRPSVLSILRTYNHGPECKRIGKLVVYTKGALDAWADEQQSQQDDAA